MDTNWSDFKNFKPSEFGCGCGCVKEVKDMDYKLIYILQAVRNRYGKPVNITSGYRCQKYNDSLKGSIKKSYHIKKKAADFTITGVTTDPNNRDEIIGFMSQLPGYKSAYHDADGSKPNMGIAIHIEVF